MLGEFMDIRDTMHNQRRSFSFNKHLVMMNEVNGTQVHHIHFKEAQFWLCLHDLPLMVKNEIWEDSSEVK